MSQSCHLRTDIAYPDKTYSEKYLVESDLEDAKERRNLLIWDLVRKNTSLDGFELKQLTDGLQEICEEIWKLTLLQDNWDDLDRGQFGDFIVPRFDEKPKFWGDFVNVHCVSQETKK